MTPTVVAAGGCRRRTHLAGDEIAAEGRVEAARGVFLVGADYAAPPGQALGNSRAVGLTGPPGPTIS